MYGRRLTAQQKDERQQDNGDKKRLACHHPSDLLHSLTRERIDGGQHFELHHFRTFHVHRMRHVYTSLAAQTLTQEERVWSISHVSNTPRISWRVNWVSDEWRRGRLPFLACCFGETEDLPLQNGIPIYVHTYFIRCAAAEYAIQKSDGNLTRLSSHVRVWAARLCVYLVGSIIPH